MRKLEHSTRRLASLLCRQSRGEKAVDGGQANDTTRTPFENMPNGLNLTVELEAPDDAYRKLQEIMDTMRAEKRVEQMEKIEHLKRNTTSD